MLLTSRDEAARALADRLGRYGISVEIGAPLRPSGQCEWVMHVHRRLEVEVVFVRELVFGFRRYDHRRTRDEDGWFGTTEDLADVAATLKYRTVGSR